jgi:hypothetical protein
MGLLIQEADFAGVARAATIAILRGLTLREWWADCRPEVMTELPDSMPGARMQYFLSELEIDETPTTLSGCFQTSTFPRRAAAGQPPVSLAEWVRENFLMRARWRNPDGSRSGFGYHPVMVLDDDGVRLVDEDLQLRISEVGARYKWAAVRLDLYDYMRALPHVGRFNKLLQPLNKEAGYIVLHPAFFESPHPPPPGCVEEVTFAYSVAPWTVMPTIAAYGPGRFHAAFKQFRFYLMEDGTVSIEVLFLVTPRCPRVFNIVGVDPVFDTVRLLDALTLRRTRINERAHAGVDHFAMGHHARIHHNLLAGMRHVWEDTNWQPAGR